MTEASEGKAALAAVSDILRRVGEHDLALAQLSEAMDKLAGVKPSASPNEPAAAPSVIRCDQSALPRAGCLYCPAVFDGAEALAAHYRQLHDSQQYYSSAGAATREGAAFGTSGAKDVSPAEPLPSERPKMPERPPLEAAAEHGGLIAYEAADYEWTGQEFARYALALELDREYLRGQINALGFKLNSVAADRDSRPTRREAITAMRRCETDNVSSGYDEVLDSVLAARGKEAKRAD